MAPWLDTLCVPNLLNFIGSMAVTKSNHDVITGKINFLSRLVTAPSVLSELEGFESSCIVTSGSALGYYTATHSAF